FGAERLQPALEMPSEARHADPGEARVHLHSPLLRLRSRASDRAGRPSSQQAMTLDPERVLEVRELRLPPRQWGRILQHAVALESRDDLGIARERVAEAVQVEELLERAARALATGL